jgi:hypothetical protein
MGLKEDGTDPTTVEDKLPKRLVYTRWSNLLLQIEDQSTSVNAARATIAKELAERVDSRVTAARALDSARKAGVLGMCCLSCVLHTRPLRHEVIRVCCAGKEGQGFAAANKESGAMFLGAAVSSDVSGSDVDRKKTSAGAKRDQYQQKQLEVGNNMVGAMQMLADALRGKRFFVDEFKTNDSWLKGKLKFSEALCASFSAKYPDPMDLAGLNNDEVIAVVKDDVLARRWATMRALYA